VESADDAGERHQRRRGEESSRFRSSVQHAPSRSSSHRMCESSYSDVSQWDRELRLRADKESLGDQREGRKDPHQQALAKGCANFLLPTASANDDCCFDASRSSLASTSTRPSNLSMSVTSSAASCSPSPRHKWNIEAVQDLPSSHDLSVGQMDSGTLDDWEVEFLLRDAMVSAEIHMEQQSLNQIVDTLLVTRGRSTTTQLQNMPAPGRVPQRLSQVVSLDS